MDEKSKIAVFQDKKIRKVWHDGEWYFSVVDIVVTLTKSETSNVLKVLRERLRMKVTKPYKL